MTAHVSDRSVLRCQPLTAQAFAPFGEVIETSRRDSRLINHGLTDKYEQLAKLEVDAGARLQVAIYRSRPVSLPFALQEVERHPLACQLFMPLGTQPFPLVVAHTSAAPQANELHAFISNGRQGVVLKAGVWHHHQLSLQIESDYLVIERSSDDGNLELARLNPPVYLDHET